MGEADDLEWDDVKDETNRQKHGLPLVLASLIFDGRPRFERGKEHAVTGELRYSTIAEIDGVVLFCVWAWRGAKRRIISLRRANQRERNAYAKATR